MGIKNNPFLQTIYNGSVVRLALKIRVDPSHIMFSKFNRLPSGRSYKAHKCKTNRLKLSFILAPITLLNNETCWLSHVSQ